MSKPGARRDTPSRNIDRFTDREPQQEVFRHHLNSPTEPPVVMFYGIGGAGKTWLLKKLRTELDQSIPNAILDLAVESSGQRYINDPATAFAEIRKQFDIPAPKFELAYAMMRHKQEPATDEPAFKGGTFVGTAYELIAEAIQKPAENFPGVNVVINKLAKPLRDRLRNTPLETLLATTTGNTHALELRRMTSQEIGDRLLDYLAQDLNQNLPVRLHQAARAVLFIDTFEAIDASTQNPERRRYSEQWVQQLTASLPILTVIAGQNQLDWDILWTADDPDSDGFHCFSLGLCADTVFEERSQGKTTAPETLTIPPGKFEELARRFMKSQNLQQAIHNYEAALRILTEHALPHDHPRTTENLHEAQTALKNLQPTKPVAPDFNQ